MSVAAARGVSSVEIEKFRRLQHYWWCADGPLRTLHFFNPLRVQFISDTCKRFLISLESSRVSGIAPGTRVLDVGCGGGILAESLARLGANVLGIDMCEESLSVAQGRREQVLREMAFLCPGGDTLSLEYRHVPLTTLVAEEKQQFDLVVASEVLEHVENALSFVQDLCNATKPGGLLIISTMDKSIRTAITHIAFAEYITGLVSPGTHDWSKFVPPQDLSECALRHNVRQIDLQYILASPAIFRSVFTRQLQLNFSLSKNLNTGHYFWSGLKVATPNVDTKS